MEYKVNNLKHGKQRSINKFLLLPKTLRVGNSNNYETRWFRKCKIIQTCIEQSYNESCYHYSTWSWEDLCWPE